MQILEVFRNGHEQSTLVSLTSVGNHSGNISLRQLSRMEETVCTETYLGQMQQILSIVEQVCPMDQAYFDLCASQERNMHLYKTNQVIELDI